MSRKYLIEKNYPLVDALFLAVASVYFDIFRSNISDLINQLADNALSVANLKLLIFKARNITEKDFIELDEYFQDAIDTYPNLEEGRSFFLYVLLARPFSIVKNSGLINSTLGNIGFAQPLTSL